MFLIKVSSSIIECVCACRFYVNVKKIEQLEWLTLKRLQFLTVGAGPSNAVKNMRKDLQSEFYNKFIKFCSRHYFLLHGEMDFSSWDLSPTRITHSHLKSTQTNISWLPCCLSQFPFWNVCHFSSELSFPFIWLMKILLLRGPHPHSHYVSLCQGIK